MNVDRIIHFALDMADSAVLITTSCNFLRIRSTSMPARSHPINLQLEEKLNRLKNTNWDPSPSASPSVEMLCTSLTDLYQSIELLLQSQRSQQALAHDSNSVAKELEGSVRLLDAISVTRDDMSKMTQLVRDIQSAIRRRRWVISKSELEKRISVYKSFRKKMEKEMVKRVRGLKRSSNVEEDKSIYIDHKEINYGHLVVISVVKMARLITISFFESLTSFIFISRPASVTSKWSVLVRKWMSTALVTSEEAAAERMISTETARVESSLSSLICRQRTGKEESLVQYYAHDVQKQLETLETSMRVIEEELEGLFRRLIKIRVSLLNSLSC